MRRIVWHRVVLGHLWQQQHIQRRDDVKIFGWQVLDRTGGAVYAHQPVALLGRAQGPNRLMSLRTKMVLPAACLPKILALCCNNSS